MVNMKKVLLAVMVPALAVFSSCSSRSGFGNNSNCDYLVLPEAGLTLPPDSTCESVNAAVRMDLVVNVRFLGPTAIDGGLGSPPLATSLSQFLLEHYDVTYRNLTTGRSVEGVDVPRPFRESVGTIFDLSRIETLTLRGFPILLAGAKAEAPLNDASFYPGASGVVLEATLTFWGHPVTDDGAWCYGTMRWVFSIAPC